jgi:ornithine cyclodeaminase/alanine dehydrogenase-like protein (mu-crystallin family)
MKVLIVNHREVQQYLPMHECIDVMADTLKMLSLANALNPLRNLMWLPDKRGLLGMMPAFLGETGVMGLKAISVFPGNHQTEYDSHQGTVMLFETQNGRLLAMVDAGEITAIRTAAVSGVATRLLARKDAENLAILGSGVQARTHLEAMVAVRAIKRAKVWSPNRRHAQTFAKRESERRHIEVLAAESAQGAVEGADIICTVTAATDPVLEGRWIAPGTHVNAVGSSVPFARELDSAAVVKSKLFVDRRESTLNEAGDFLIPKKEGVLDDGHIRGEIGELLLGRIAGRSSAVEITLFKSLGLAVEDVAAAHHIYRKLSEQGLGTRVEMGALKTED